MNTDTTNESETVVEFDGPRVVEFLTKSGAEYTISGVTKIERAADGGLVLYKTDGNFSVIEPGFEFYDVRENI